eukprot:4029934-Amphidinium_carterae.1
MSPPDARLHSTKREATLQHQRSESTDQASLLLKNAYAIKDAEPHCARAQRKRRVHRGRLWVPYLLRLFYLRNPGACASEESPPAMLLCF